MLGIAREVRIYSQETYFNGLLHMDTLVLAHQQKTSIHLLCTDTEYHLEDLLRSMSEREIARERERERELKESVLLARLDNNNDDEGDDEWYDLW